MNFTAILHYDNFLGKGYYLVNEHMDKTWYKGDTATEAVMNYLKEFNLSPENVKITINEVV